MREHTARGQGLDLCVCAWGPEARPGQARALLLHGWLDQGAAWAPVAERLAAAGLPVLAPDHRGHGRSDHAPAGMGYPFPQYVADVDALWRGWGRPPLVLCGHSMGGTIASLFAAARPEAPLRLVLLDGLGPPRVPDEQAVASLRRHLDQLADPPRHKPLATLGDAAARLRSFTTGLSEDLALRLASRATEPHPEGGLRWRWDPLHRSTSAVPFDADRHLAQLSAITAPTASLIGLRSAYAAIPDLDAREARLPAGPRLRLDCGHALHVDAPDEVARVLLAGGLRPGFGAPALPL